MMKTTNWAMGAMLAAVFAAWGCSKSDAPTDNAPAAADKAGSSEPVAKVAATDPAAAKDMFNSRCAACHGQQGLGDGPGAAALNPKPRNYHDKAWQAKVTDDDIKKTILYGGAAVGKSPMMPASPDLDGKPELVDGLVHIVRDFGKS